MIVLITKFGKKMTKKAFDLEYQTDKFKAYMKNQKRFIKSFTVSKTTASVVIHADLEIKEMRIRNRVYFGKPLPINSLYVSSIDAEILLGY